MSAPPSFRVRKAASKSADPQTAANELFEAIHQSDAALILFYCAPNYDLDALGHAIAARFGSAPVIGCTTAGEITADRLSGRVAHRCEHRRRGAGLECAHRRPEPLRVRAR